MILKHIVMLLSQYTMMPAKYEFVSFSTILTVLNVTMKTFSGISSLDVECSLTAQCLSLITAAKWLAN